jgi:hypothetical protein
MALAHRHFGGGTTSLDDIKAQVCLRLQIILVLPFPRNLQHFLSIFKALRLHQYVPYETVCCADVIQIFIRVSSLTR